MVIDYFGCRSEIVTGCEIIFTWSTRYAFTLYIYSSILLKRLIEQDFDISDKFPTYNLCKIFYGACKKAVFVHFLYPEYCDCDFLLYPQNLIFFVSFLVLTFTDIFIVKWPKQKRLWQGTGNWKLFKVSLLSMAYVSSFFTIPNYFCLLLLVGILF